MWTNMISYIKGIINYLISQFLRPGKHAFIPRSLNLDVTWRCNLSCIMCSARERVQKFNKEDLTPEKFEYIVTQLPKTRHIDIMGLGEPLANPHFFELLALAQSKNIEVSIIANGTLLNENNIKKFSKNLTKVSVSVDSPYPAKFDRIRKGATFSSVIENIRKLKKLRPKVRIGLLVVLMKENIEDLPELVKLAKDIGADSIGLNHILSLDKENDERRISSTTDKAEYYLQKTEDLAKKYKIKLTSRPLQPRMRRCWQPWSGPLVLLNGDVYPCCFMDRSPESVCTEWFSGVPIEIPFHQYRMGNIFEESFEKIWNDDNFKHLRKMIREAEKGPKQISTEELNIIRQKIDIKEKFAYCKVCLWRWSMAC